MSRWRCLPPLLALVVVLASCGSPAGDTKQGRALAAPAATQPATPFAVATAAAPVATPGGTLEVVAASPPPSCRVTRRPGPPFTPPPPYPPTPPALYGDRFWYGTDSLWTWLPADGVWRGWHRDGAYAYADKSIWWRHGYDGRTEQRPELTVSGRRLDAPAPIFENHGGDQRLPRRCRLVHAHRRRRSRAGLLGDYRPLRGDGGALRGLGQPLKGGGPATWPALRRSDGVL